jgi:hypothetical protein
MRPSACEGGVTAPHLRQAARRALLPDAPLPHRQRPCACVAASSPHRSSSTHLIVCGELAVPLLFLFIVHNVPLSALAKCIPHSVRCVIAAGRAPVSRRCASSHLHALVVRARPRAPHSCAVTAASPSPPRAVVPSPLRVLVVHACAPRRRAMDPWCHNRGHVPSLHHRLATRAFTPHICSPHSCGYHVHVCAIAQPKPLFVCHPHTLLFNGLLVYPSAIRIASSPKLISDVYVIYVMYM